MEATDSFDWDTFQMNCVCEAVKATKKSHIFTAHEFNPDTVLLQEIDGETSTALRMVKKEFLGSDVDWRLKIQTELKVVHTPTFSGHQS